MIRSKLIKLQKIYRKNKDDYLALFGGLYPSFIYKKQTELFSNEIAVFAFHTVNAEYFERQLEYLASNNYQTLDAQELVGTLNGKRKPRKNTVALTFDDGRGSLWSVAYPLLKKYDMKAIAFVVPGAVPEEGRVHTKLDDLSHREGISESVENRENSAPLCNWLELVEMDKSGVIDIQSHTTYHSSVFVDDQIIDFVNPGYLPSFLNSTFNPVVQQNGEDVCLAKLEWGHPVYTRGASMASKIRYVEDERLSDNCTRYVRNNGGIEFFERYDWRRQLQQVADAFRTSAKSMGRYQSYEERKKDILSDLLKSKTMLEERLEKKVCHLCYPWYEGSEMSAELSKEAGYQSNHWGILPGKKVIVKIGDDPFFITRMNDEYVFCLPGKQRKNLFSVQSEKYFRRFKNISR